MRSTGGQATQERRVSESQECLQRNRGQLGDAEAAVGVRKQGAAPSVRPSRNRDMSASVSTPTSNPSITLGDLEGKILFKGDFSQLSRNMDFFLKKKKTCC